MSDNLDKRQDTHSHIALQMILEYQSVEHYLPKNDESNTHQQYPI